MGKTRVYELRAHGAGAEEEAAAAVEWLGRWIPKRGVEPKSMRGHRPRRARRHRHTRRRRRRVPDAPAPPAEVTAENTAWQMNPRRGDSRSPKALRSRAGGRKDERPVRTRELT